MESTLPRNQTPRVVAVTSMSRALAGKDDSRPAPVPERAQPRQPRLGNGKWNPFVTAWIVFTLAASATRLILESVWSEVSPNHQLMFRRCEAFSLFILVILACHSFRLYGILARPNSWSALKRTYLWVPLTAVWLFRAAYTLKWSEAEERLLISIVVAQVWFFVVVVLQITRNGIGTVKELKRHLDLVMVFFCGYFVFGGLEKGVTQVLRRFLNDKTQEQQSALAEVFVTLTSRILMSTYIIISELSIGIVFGKQDLWLVFGHRLLETMTVTSVALDNVTSTNALILHGFSNLLIVFVRDSGILEDLLFCFNHRLTLGDIYAIPDGHNPIIRRATNQSRMHALFRNGGVLHTVISLRAQISAGDGTDSGSFSGSTSVSQDDLNDDALTNKVSKSSPGFLVGFPSSRDPTGSYVQASSRRVSGLLPPVPSSSAGHSRNSLPRPNAAVQNKDELSEWIGSLPRAYPSIGRTGTLDRRRRANVTLERRANGTLERRQDGVGNTKGTEAISDAAEATGTSAVFDSSSGTTAYNGQAAAAQSVPAPSSSQPVAAASVPLLKSWHKSLQLQVDRMQHSLIVRVATVLAFALCELLDRSIRHNWALRSDKDWELSNFRLHLIGLLTITANVSVCMVYLVLSSKVEAMNELNRLATRNLRLKSQSSSGSTTSSESSASHAPSSSLDSSGSLAADQGQNQNARQPVVVTTMLESQALPQTIVSINRKGSKRGGAGNAIIESALATSFESNSRPSQNGSLARSDTGNALDTRQVSSRGARPSVSKANAPILPLIQFWQINTLESTSMRQLVIACLVCTFFRFAEVYASS
ncbi:hypothetical protein BCR44DRAFT_1513069 [Catenaria anguillulae PL171]|uniref:Uncharacterized protein n=1 Tax=Catenaria anguillulae PL171 TaxID=765915 RepID=A0A1Y2HNN2_9FUNG|nr:hypothetical protein BCR44DRAFT_1513069 [Catenaria anguillulae PL171]